MTYRVEQIVVLRCDKCSAKIEDPYEEKILKEDDDVDILTDMDIHLCRKCTEKGVKEVSGNDLIKYCKKNNIKTDEIEFWKGKRFIGIQSSDKKWDLSDLKWID